MKQLSIVLAMIGLAVSTALVARSGFGPVAQAVLSVGAGGFVLLLAWQAVLFVTLGLPWGVLLRTMGPAPYWLPMWGRMVRDAAGNCLPFSQLAGYVFGARAITLHGVSWPRAAATTVVDITAEFLAQVVFAVFGLCMLLLRAPDTALAWPVAIGLALAVVGGGLFVWLQSGAAPLVRFLAARIAGERFGHTSLRIEAVQAEMNGLYRSGGRLLGAWALHLLGWVCSGIGSWISYRLLGAPIDLLSALAIEALLTAALTLAFAVPGYAGVQEAAFTGLGAIYGLPSDISLGVSILRRARDLAFGVPILLVWQVIEARRVRARAVAADRG